MVNKVAEIYGAHMGVKLNPLTEVLGTLGANGSLHSFIQGWLNPGDELVTFEPMFPMYLDHIEMSGGRLRAVPLNYSDKEWMFNPEELRKALSAPNVKVFIFNSPHNPTGKVFSSIALVGKLAGLLAPSH